MNIIRFEKAELVDGKLSWSAIHNGYDYPDVENTAKIGLPIPKRLKQILEQLNKDEVSGEDENNV